MARPTRIGDLVPRLLIFCSLLLGGTLAYGQPVVNLVTDSAGYGPRVAPGSLASLFGTSLASAIMQAPAGKFPLPTTLASVSVEVGGAAVPLLYVSPTQINFQVPSATAAGDATLVVNAPAGTSSSFTFTVTSSAPSIFQYGANHAVAQNYPTYALNSDSAPAASGSVIIVYLTGIGAVTPAVTDGAASPSPVATAMATATATIGIASATIQFLGLSPGFVGLAQANILVPSGLATGDYPLVITVGGYISISAVLSVSGSGTYTSPLTLVGTAPFTNSATSSVVLLDNYVFVCGANSIQVVDVTTVTAPVAMGEFGNSTLGGYGTFCALNNQTGTPFLVDVVGPLVNSSLQPLDVSFAVFDVSTPTAPVLLGVTSAQYPYLVSLSFYSTYAFASTSYFTYYTSNQTIEAQTGEYLAYTFATPATPELLGVLSPSLLSDQSLKPYSAVVDSTYAFIASTTATGADTGGTGVLNVINISTPSALTLVGQVSAAPASILLSFDVSGNLLLASGNTTGNSNPGTPNFGFSGDLTLTTMDITNPASPVVLESGSTGMQVDGTFTTAAFPGGFFAIVSNPPLTDPFGPQSLMIVDATQPANVVLYPFQTQFGFSGLVPTSAGYLLAATSLGLNIYQLQL